MKIIRTLGLLGAATAAALGAATATATAALADPATATAKSPSHTVEGVQTHVAARTQKITTNLTAMKSRVAANKRFSATAKSTIQTDISKILNDTATWRSKIAAASTMVAVHAASPSRDAVNAGLTKLRTDLAAARTEANAGKATAGQANAGPVTTTN